MKDFVRLNPVSESILKVLVKHNRATPDNLSFALICDKVKLGDYLRSLMAQGYVVIIIKQTNFFTRRVEEFFQRRVR